MTLVIRSCMFLKVSILISINYRDFKCSSGSTTLVFGRSEAGLVVVTLFNLYIAWNVTLYAEYIVYCAEYILHPLDVQQDMQIAT
jgi:hypothetical protein